MNPHRRINGQPGDRIAADDRGLSYGDGLFETVWVHEHQAPLWPRHMARLAEGCRRLDLPLPDPDWLWQETLLVVADLACAVVRITWTRGGGPRGYATPVQVQPTCIVSAASHTPWPADWYHHGIRMHVCRTRLASQPALAGIKHLNRLEQVLARREWQDPTVGEGLMLDFDDRVISATAANMFALVDGRLHTPALDRCGVAGTARARLLDDCPDAVETDMTLDTLLAADAVFITSAVRGIVPVCELAGRIWPPSAQVAQIQTAWRDAGLPPGQVSA
ncbi:MAG TPA: aminodeoxychorismate lyase [Rhodanobacteraceae bacterium]